MGWASTKENVIVAVISVAAGLCVFGVFVVIHLVRKPCELDITATEELARLSAENAGLRQPPGADLVLAEEDPKIYLVPLNEEFKSTGIIPFDMFNNGQRVNIAHSIRVQPVPNLPSVSFEYVNHLEMNQHKRLLPIIDGAGVFQTHNILPVLGKAWEKQCQMTGQVQEDFAFEITIHYEDVSGCKHFKTTVSLKYSPTRHIVESHDVPLAFSRPENKIVELVGMNVKRVS
jgi:hypothetical protein